jgi:hypothetical protein
MTTSPPTPNYRCCLCGECGNHYSFKGIRDIIPSNFPEQLQDKVSEIIHKRIRINRETLNEFFGFIPQGFVACPNFCSFCKTGGHSCLDELAANHQYSLATDKEVFGDFLRFIDTGDFSKINEYSSSIVKDIGMKRISTVISCRFLKRLFNESSPVVAPSPVVEPSPVVATQNKPASSIRTGKGHRRQFQAETKRINKERIDDIESTLSVDDDYNDETCRLYK